MAPSALSTLDEYHTNLTLPIPVKSFESAITDHGANYSTPESHRLIGNALKTRIDDIDHDTCEVGDEDAFFVADLGEVYRQHLRWKLHLPRVKPHYGQRSSSMYSFLF
jgi:ornithine decarboxylase